MMLSILPELIHGQLATERTSVNVGKSSGEILEHHGFGGHRGLAKRVSTILTLNGCQTGHGSLGRRNAKTFDEMKADLLMRQWLGDYCRKYIQNKNGQGVLQLVQKKDTKNG